MLNSFFVSQSTLDDTAHLLPNECIVNDEYSLSAVKIQPSEVRDVLITLNVGKASGPDGINNIVSRQTANELAIPLCQFFIFSLDSCNLPSSWKISNVCPIFKSGDPSLPYNFRPVSLLNTMETVFEKIISKHVFNFLIETRFFIPYQSGFLPGDSTINQLTFLYNKICKALDEGLEVRFIFSDISKAFDKVWYKGLIFKLKRAGIHEKLLAWFSDYLCNRCQRVVLPGCQSNTKHFNAGVPQGSVLFLVYINDIVEDIESGINLFADDTSLEIPATKV